MNWILVIMVLIVAYYVWGRKYLAPIDTNVIPIIISEGYHNPLHYNKQRTPDIDSYSKLTTVYQSPDYRGY